MAGFQGQLCSEFALFAGLEEAVFARVQASGVKESLGRGRKDNTPRCGAMNCMMFLQDASTLSLA